MFSRLKKGSEKMKVERLSVGINEINSINPITNKTINRGYKAEIAYKATKNGYIDYQLDNKINTKFGDNQKGNYIYQVKAYRCEIKLVKSIEEQVNGFEQVLKTYVKYNKANRYVYIVEDNNISYAITMTKTEFIEFVLLFGRYSSKRNNIRIGKSDKTILSWASVKLA